MKRVAFLHIGLPKTGSTSLQSFLTRNRARLRRQGAYYPRCLGRTAHVRLGAYAVAYRPREEGPAAARPLHERLGIRSQDDWQAFCAETEDKLDQELQSLDGKIDRVLFSNVQVYGAESGQPGLERIKALLRRHFDQLRVIVYLRRQDERLASAYSTALERGVHTSIDQWANHERDWSMDYVRVLADLAAVFGKEALIPRLYRQDLWPDGDLIMDFAQVVGLNVEADFVRPSRENASLDMISQEMLRRLNLLLPPAGSNLENWGRSAFIARLNKQSEGKGRALSDQLRHRLLERYAASNEEVRQAWFPKQSSLFAADEGPSELPEEGWIYVHADQVLERLAKLLPEVSLDRMELQAQGLRYQGQDEKALDLFMRVLELDPGRGSARLQVVALLLDGKRLDAALAELQRLRDQSDNLGEQGRRDLKKLETRLKELRAKAPRS